MVPISSNDVLEYRNRLAFNREFFLLKYGFAFHAFTQIDSNFNVLGQILQSKKDKNGKSRVSFIPFVLLMQRQARAAFEGISSFQSYEAWVLLRPCLEAALIMGKWEDDPQNCNIWKNRAEDREAYWKTYTGRKLRSTALPRSDRLQTVLSRINDDFIHANPDYYLRHTKIQPQVETVGILVHYFDDAADHEAHLHAVLHLILVVQDSAAGMLRQIFGGLDPLTVALDVYENEFAPRVRKFLERSPSHKTVLAELGLWPEEAGA
ncbi:MAG: hypothetical protein HY652_00035 [Acidobacteria bacterium]|nr:hypothetical protein [Acidobacteriota bacterium]